MRFLRCMRWAYVGSVGLCLLVCGCGPKKQSPHVVPSDNVAALVTLIDPNPPSQSFVMATPPPALEIVNLVNYSEMSCSADYNHQCDDYYSQNAPSGWQVCSFFYTRVSRNNATTFEVQSTSWYPNDSNPPRFKGYSLHFGVFGSTNWLDQWGSNLDVKNVGMRIIPDWATNSDRKSLGCQMPSRTEIWLAYDDSRG